MEYIFVIREMRKMPKPIGILPKLVVAVEEEAAAFLKVTISQADNRRVAWTRAGPMCTRRL